jgi:hypothetical protein
MPNFRQCVRQATLCATIAAVVPSLAFAQPFDPARPSAQIKVSPELSAAEARIEEALASKVDIAFKDATLDEVAAWVRKQHGIDVVVDREALKATGVDHDATFSHALKRVSLEAGLELLLLTGQRISLAIIDDKLHFTSAEKADDALTRRKYPVRDLIVRKDEKSRESRDDEALIEFITAICNPTSWDAIGGAGSIEIAGDALDVQQSWEVHRTIRRQLAQLRAVIKCQAAGDYTAVETDPPSPVEAEINRALDQKMDLAVGKMSLAKFAEHVAKVGCMNVVIDEKDLENAGLDASKLEIAGVVKGQSLRRAMTKLLFEKYELHGIVTRDVLLICAIQSGCQWPRSSIYPIADLLPTGDAELDAVSALEDRITSTIAPTTWDAVGGSANIRYFDAWRIMLISQTSDEHKQISKHFDQLRKAKAKPPSREAGASRKGKGS